MLSTEQKLDWDEKGFFIIRGFMPIEDCRAMHARVVEISRLNAAGERVPNVFVMPEKKPNPHARNPEDSVGKIFRLHRDPIFSKITARSDSRGIRIRTTSRSPRARRSESGWPSRKLRSTTDACT